MENARAGGRPAQPVRQLRWSVRTQAVVTSGTARDENDFALACARSPGLTNANQ